MPNAPADGVSRTPAERRMPPSHDTSSGAFAGAAFRRSRAGSAAVMLAIEKDMASAAPAEVVTDCQRGAGSETSFPRQRAWHAAQPITAQPPTTGLPLATCEQRTPCPGASGAVPPPPHTAFSPSLTATPHCFTRSTVAALSLSVVSSVSLVIVNKYLISTLGFPYGASPPRTAHSDAAQPRHTRPSRLAPSAPQ